MEKKVYKPNVSHLAQQDKVKAKEIIFGTHPIIEALSAEKEIEKILIQKGTIGQQINEIIADVRIIFSFSKIILICDIFVRPKLH